MSTIVTSKGQVTIPKKVRDYLRIKPGTAVDFKMAEDGRIVLERTRKPKTPHASRFARFRGTATVKMTTDEIMRLMRGD